MKQGSVQSKPSGLHRHFRPDDLADRNTGRHTPAGGQHVHEKQAAHGLIVGGRRRGRGPVRGRVPRLDTDQTPPRIRGQAKPEVEPWHTPVAYGVGGELRHQQGDGAGAVRGRRMPPLLQDPHCEPQSEMRTSGFEVNYAANSSCADPVSSPGSHASSPSGRAAACVSRVLCALGRDVGLPRRRHLRSTRTCGTDPRPQQAGRPHGGPPAEDYLAPGAHWAAKVSICLRTRSMASSSSSGG